MIRIKKQRLCQSCEQVFSNMILISGWTKTSWEKESLNNKIFYTKRTYSSFYRDINWQVFILNHRMHF